MKKESKDGKSLFDLPYFMRSQDDGEIHSRAHALLKAWALGGTGKPPSKLAQVALDDYLAAKGLHDEDRKWQIRLLSEAVLSAVAVGVQMSDEPTAKALLSKLGRQGGAKKHAAHRLKKEQVRARWASGNGKLSKNAAATRWAKEYGVKPSTIRAWLIDPR